MRRQYEYHRGSADGMRWRLAQGWELWERSVKLHCRAADETPAGSSPPPRSVHLSRNNSSDCLRARAPGGRVREARRACSVFTSMLVPRYSCGGPPFFWTKSTASTGLFVFLSQKLARSSLVSPPTTPASVTTDRQRRFSDRSTPSQRGKADIDLSRRKRTPRGKTHHQRPMIRTLREFG